MGLSYDQCVLDELALAMDKIDEGSLEAAKETILQTEADGGRVHVTGSENPLMLRDILLHCFHPPVRQAIF